MNIIDLIALRDLIVIDTYAGTLDAPDEERQKAVAQLQKAFKKASDELFKEQAPILVGPEKVSLLMDYLNRDIFSEP
jgi:hypothetical protein